MPEKPPLEDADYALIQRLLKAYDIDAADPERLERLVVSVWWGQQVKPAKGKVGAKYRKATEDCFILKMVGLHLAKQQKMRGMARPSIREAAISLAKKPPFTFWGMSSETIRQRHRGMLKRLGRGKGLQPDLLRLMDWMAKAECGHLRQQAQKAEK